MQIVEKFEAVSSISCSLRLSPWLFLPWHEKARRPLPGASTLLLDSWNMRNAFLLFISYPLCGSFVVTARCAETSIMKQRGQGCEELKSMGHPKRETNAEGRKKVA